VVLKKFARYQLAKRSIIEQLLLGGVTNIRKNALYAGIEVGLSKLLRFKTVLGTS
jgi:hypothetical protein